MRQPTRSISTAGMPSFSSNELMRFVTEHFSLNGTRRHRISGDTSRISRAISLVMSYPQSAISWYLQTDSGCTIKLLHSNSENPAAARASSADALSGSRGIVPVSLPDKTILTHFSNPAKIMWRNTGTARDPGHADPCPCLTSRPLEFISAENDPCPCLSCLQRQHVAAHSRASRTSILH